jgi:hypothetical protein
MYRKHGYNMIELMLVTALVGWILTGCFPLLVHFMESSPKFAMRFCSIQSLDRIASRMGEDIRSSGEIFCRENSRGFVLLMFSDEQGSPYHVTYNISDAEPHTLYRTEVRPDKSCTVTKMTGRILSMKLDVQGDNLRMVTVELTLPFPGSETMATRQYSIKAAMRVFVPPTK